MSALQRLLRSTGTARARFTRGAGGLFTPERPNDPRLNVLLVLERKGERPRIIRTHNIITSAGDIWYAQKATGEAVTNTFANAVLGTGKTAAWAKASTYTNLLGAIAGANKAVSATYPKRNDGDAQNTGAGVNVITWLFSYTGADFVSATAVTDGVITIAAPIAGSALLAGFTLASSFTFTVDDTLKLFVNHTLLGV